MNRSELIDEVARRLETNRKAAADAVDAVVDTIKAEVAKGEKVAISGFGIFEKIQRGARTARNPFDGSTIKVKAKSVPKFKPGAEFRKFVENPRAALKKASTSAKSTAKKTTSTAKATAESEQTTAKETAAKATAPAKKTAAKKAPAKKTAAKKAPAKKAPAKKTTT
jgi:DNA-binding protein HU-beta